LLAALDPACVPPLLRITPVQVADDALAIREAVRIVFDAIEVPPLPKGVRVETFPRVGDVPPLRAYHPDQRRHPGAALMWIHGGGLIAGAARYDDLVCSRMAADHGVPVVSVDYRLAPEFPYPCALEDCFAAMTWMLGDAEVGAESGRLVVTGGSAGGCLAVALGLLARDRGVDALRALVCAYPMLDDRPGSPSMDRLTARRIWHRDANRVAWQAYVGHLTDVPVHAAPGRTTVDDLRGLPPVHLDVGTLDGFFDETLAFAGRLARADVEVDLVVTPRAAHGSEHLNVDAPTSRRILAARRAARERALAQPYPAVTDDPADRPRMLHRPRELAASFDRAAAGYDARPGYPERVYELLTEHGALRPGTRVLEIGPGVGQATLPLVDRGASVVAVEPGRALAGRLRERVPGDALEILVADFESVAAGEAEFDLVVAATSFHWIDPVAGVAKAASVLRDGGWLALWWNVWGDDARPDPVHEALVPILRAKAPHMVGDDMSATAFLRDIEARVDEIGRSGAFAPVTVELIRWEGQHDPDGLRRMFATFGAWISLPDSLREELLDDVQQLARGLGGVVRRPYQTVVYLARREPRDVPRLARATESV
jgi:acetyl esterase/lipase/SAM-dependent methyltransferase